jgi:uncharacterized protein YicC (UPF0701 family)
MSTTLATRNEVIEDAERRTITAALKEIREALERAERQVEKPRSETGRRIAEGITGSLRTIRTALAKAEKAVKQRKIDYEERAEIGDALEEINVALGDALSAYAER